jgi:hypothetical protein
MTAAFIGLVTEPSRSSDPESTEAGMLGGPHSVNSGWELCDLRGKISSDGFGVGGLATKSTKGRKRRHRLTG